MGIFYQMTIPSSQWDTDYSWCYEVLRRVLRTGTNYGDLRKLEARAKR